MITFNRSADPHSLDIVRDGQEIGYLQWHINAEPNITLRREFERLTISEMKQALAKYKEIGYV